MRVRAGIYDLLGRLVHMSGRHLLFDQAYHGRSEMRIVRMAERLGFVVIKRTQGNIGHKVITITSAGVDYYEKCVEIERNLSIRNALCILRLRNGLRSISLPFRAAILKRIDEIIRKLRGILSIGREFDSDR